MKIGIVGVDCGLCKIVAALRYVKKRQRSRIRKTQRNIQIPESYITVDAENTLSLCGQRNRQTGADGSFTGSTLSGYDSDHNAQRKVLPLHHLVSL